jgi:O-methyltransferase involved in polyketide biosynthesis
MSSVGATALGAATMRAVAPDTTLCGLDPPKVLDLKQQVLARHSVT